MCSKAKKYMVVNEQQHPEIFEGIKIVESKLKSNKLKLLLQKLKVIQLNLFN